MPPEPPTRRRVLRGVALGGGDVVLGAEGLFVRRGELVASGVEDVAVHPKATTSYPESDALHLDEGPEVVYVYLRVEDLATDRELEARVERWSRTPALARPFGGGQLRVSDEEETRLSTSDGRGSGVVRFAVRAWFGGPLPAGD